MRKVFISDLINSGYLFNGSVLNGDYRLYIKDI